MFENEDLMSKYHCIKANNDNRTEENKNNDPTIPNLPLPIKVKHP